VDASKLEQTTHFVSGPDFAIRGKAAAQALLELLLGRAVPPRA